MSAQVIISKLSFIVRVRRLLNVEVCFGEVFGSFLRVFNFLNF